MIYQYDGSIEGLFSGFYDAFIRKEKPEMFQNTHKNQESLLFSDLFQVKNEPRKYNQVIKWFNQIHKKAVYSIFACFYSEYKNIEKDMFEYFYLGLNQRHKLKDYLKNEHLYRFYDISRKVRREIHQYKGFIRFEEVKKNFYYAPIDSRYNIISFLAFYFAKKYSDKNWVIHDIKRNNAAYFDLENIKINKIKKDSFLGLFKRKLKNNDQNYKKLWKVFYDEICIEERRNMKLHTQLLPKKFWPYLIEKQ